MYIFFNNVESEIAVRDTISNQKHNSHKREDIAWFQTVKD